MADRMAQVPPLTPWERAFGSRRTTPYGEGLLAPYLLGPQGGNEPDLVFGTRRGIVDIAKKLDPMPLLEGAVGSVGNTWNYAFDTPNKRQGRENEMLVRAFNSMVQTESRGRQTDARGRPLTSPKGAIGIAQVMPGTAPEAAKLAGLPFDEKRYRTDPQYNWALGFAYFKQKMKENKGDVTKAMAAYNAGQGRVQQAEARAAKSGQPWTAFLPGETQQYIQSTMQRMAGEFGAPPPAFNQQPWNEASSLIDKGTQALMQPTAFSTPEAPRPDRPTPTPFAAPDYTASDAAFEKAAPVNPFADEKEKVKLQKQKYFQGMAAALGSIDFGKGVGLGELFAKLGAGALGGRLHADDVIRSKQEEFDENMRRYNLALAERKGGQAREIANVANQNISQMNQHNDNLFVDRLSEWSRNLPQVSDGNLVTRRPDPANPGQVITTITPISNAPIAAGFFKKAELAIGLGNARADYDRMVWGASREDARTAMAYVLSDPTATPAQHDQAAVVELASRANAAVDAGRWRSMYSTERAQAIENEARAAVGVLKGQPPTAEQMEQLNNYIASQVLQDTVQGGQEAIKLLYSGSAAASAVQEARDRRVTTTTRRDARGRVSTSTSVRE